jgi:hypothetical protein
MVQMAKRIGEKDEICEARTLCGSRSRNEVRVKIRRAEEYLSRITDN